MPDTNQGIKMEQHFSSLDSVKEPETVSKNGAGSTRQACRSNIKYFTLLLTICFLLQSCFTTRFASNEQTLANNFRGASVDEIEFALGNPHKVEKLANGYVYTYYYGRRGEMYERYMFGNNDKLIRIQSTNGVKERYYSPGRTLFAVIGGFVAFIAVLALALGSE